MEVEKKYFWTALWAVVFFALGNFFIGLAAKHFWSQLVVPNPGIVFGLPLSSTLAYLLTGVVIASLILVYKNFASDDRVQSIAFGMMVGGALANFFDRVVFGYVIDFIHLQVFGLSGVWNTADFTILFGIIIWLSKK